jgi:hypothetical protein
MTQSHLDYFQKNVTAMRAELRESYQRCSSLRPSATQGASPRKGLLRWWHRENVGKLLLVLRRKTSHQWLTWSRLDEDA